MESFEFGLHPYAFTKFPIQGWTKKAQQLEKQGYSLIVTCDHFQKEYHDPIALLTATATATTKIRIGTSVFCVDYRHPVILAKAAASLHLISNGRFELGIGAGDLDFEYHNAGIQWDKAATRIRRLEEALKIIKSMLTNEETNFEGKYYQIKNMPKAGYLDEGDSPKIMVGGGGKMLLGVAGRHADIVGILRERITRLSDSLKESDYAGIKRKIQLVKDAALKVGRDIEEIRFQKHFFRPVITDDVESAMKAEAKMQNCSPDMLRGNPHFLFGDVDEVVMQLEALRAETGISYINFITGDPNQFDLFAKVIKRMNR
jgi:probable F420-dependent oxidoreductase